ncbi:hypothetical protein [Subsaximicrobium wynnwilliamsii]|uniref:hypothetical protein n=1 Tax=Subsaximicrobium wynnwilliamsii TaxID=291179 RepID=UPI00167A1FB6|nr:hypothetical protein [Subsaximicrobium wynnwilliamsii]
MKNFKRIAFVILLMIQIGVLVWSIVDKSFSESGSATWLMGTSLGITVIGFVKSEKSRS